MHKYVADLVAVFDKLIKRNPKDFPVISDIEDWNKFRQGMQATAKVQGVESPVDPTYIPSAINQALFYQQNGYAYKVLMDVVKDLRSRLS
jgi:hypothetical protein